MASPDYTANSHAGYHSDPRPEPRYASLEIFWLGENELAADTGDSLTWLDSGWYWQLAEPEQAPDSNVFGPFNTSFAAFNDAQDY